MNPKPEPVLVAGIGGASLGTELLKCLRDAGRWTVFGCDVSRHAFGHYGGGAEATFVVSKERYVDDVLSICRGNGIRAVIPGGEGPLALLGAAGDALREAGVAWASNAPDVISLCSDKERFVARLRELRIPQPWTAAFSGAAELATRDDLPLPCVIKPATGSGGSRHVYLAASREEASICVGFLASLGKRAVVQEYVPVDEGEFTVGVLSAPDGRLIGSVAMQRMFHTKLSVLMESDVGLISSGYSQGLIDEFPEVRRQAEAIAAALGSRGPINIQARVRDGVLLPFEANPRFSASTYLRALAGFNEVDVQLGVLLFGETPAPVAIRPGYYLRSLDQTFVPRDEVKR